MKNKSSSFLIGLLVLLVVCLLAGGLYYYFSQQRAQSLDSRPLVLIHNPLNRDYVTVGDGIIVHATARSQAGLARMELWADDVLVAEQEAPKGIEPVLLVLSAGWVPVDPGDHRLVVRAISVNDVEGQSTIALKALDTEEDESFATHLVEQGETLETIAAGLGTSVEELADLNPSLDPGGPSAGDELVVPDDEPTHEGGDEEAPTDNPLPESESEAPSAEGDPPGERGLFLGPVMSGAEESDEPIGLQLELVSLSTGELYESLHCYVGMAGAPPQWYPDRDSDQTTDESFSVSTWGFSDPGYSEIIDGSSAASRDGKKARTRWNIDEYLSGQAVPVLFWPANLSIPFEISCVGINGGGTEALELGSLALSVEPDEWDGIVRRVEATDLEGSFTLGYRVGPVETLSGIAKEIDPDITAPTNLRTANYHALFGPEAGEENSTFFVSENDPFTLLWNYNPRSDELPIEGFRVYLNGNLQWTERTDRQIGDNHYTVFPAEWRHPPCGEQYTLTVSAWRPGGIDGHESYPAEPAIVFETPADECQRYINITLLTLETLNIGGDGRLDNRDGDVGPPFGHFYANEEIITFDTGHPDDEIIPPGLNNDDILNLQNLSISNWGLSGQLRFRAALDEYNTAVLGFEIWDEDTGDCDASDDPGCPDLICRGQEYLGDNNGHPYESEIYSSNGACKITFSVEMAVGSSPVSETSFGNTPEPLLKIENLTADDRNRSTFQVVNLGNAAWTYRTLEIEVRDRSENMLDTIIFDDFYLEPGDSHQVEYLSSDLPAVNLCFLLNIESQAGIFGTQCPGYPNLVIDEIRVDPESGATQVLVRNNGTSDLRDQNLVLELQTRSGESLGVYTWDSISLSMGETLMLEQPMMVVPAPFDACAIVDPNNNIAETNENDQRTCTPRSDLSITMVEFQAAGDQFGTMRVTVRNNQDSLTDSTIYLQTTLPDGTSANILQSFPDIDLDRNEEIVFSLGVPSAALRSQLLDGYTVAVNPYHSILETNYANNSYTVPGQTVLQLYWCGRFIPHLGGFYGSSAASMYFSASVLSGSSSRTVMEERSWSSEISGGSVAESDYPGYHNHFLYAPYELRSCDLGDNDPFTIMGDEWLNLNFRTTYRQGNYGDFEPISSANLLISPNERWGAGRISEGDSWTVCSHSGGAHYTSSSFSGENWSGAGLGMHTWHSYYLICEVVP